jgi:hypothetical protein
VQPLRSRETATKKWKALKKKIANNPALTKSSTTVSGLLHNTPHFRFAIAYLTTSRSSSVVSNCVMYSAALRSVTNGLWPGYMIGPKTRWVPRHQSYPTSRGAMSETEFWIAAKCRDVQQNILRPFGQAGGLPSCLHIEVNNPSAVVPTCPGIGR